MAKTLSKRELQRREELKLKKRRKNVLVVMGEIALCLMLAITCYGMSILNSYAYEELSPSIFKETQQMQVSKNAVEASTEVVTTIIERTNESGEVIATEEQIVEETSKLTGYRNILVLGTDARSQYSFDGGINTDVMIIVSINNDTGDIKMVSVLRDTILKMEEGSGALAYNKANDQFCVSGISDTVSMINRNLGLDIDEYVIVNWYGVATVVNQLGGIELTIPNEQILTYFNSYLDFTNQATGLWAPELQAPGTYVMSGTQVVAFCRIRYGGYNDQGRTDNQREAISKIFERAKLLLSQGQINTLLDVAQTGLGNVKSNMKLSSILYMVAELGSYNMAGSMSFPQNYTTGSIVGNYAAKYNVKDALVANDFETEVKQLHAFLFNDPNYECSDFIKNVSYQMYLDRTGQ